MDRRTRLASVCRTRSRNPYVSARSRSSGSCQPQEGNAMSLTAWGMLLGLAVVVAIVVTAIVLIIRFIVRHNRGYD
jgi:hypothetical protein